MGAEAGTVGGPRDQGAPRSPVSTRTRAEIASRAGDPELRRTPVAKMEQGTATPGGPGATRKRRLQASCARTVDRSLRPSSARSAQSLAGCLSSAPDWDQALSLHRGKLPAPTP